MKLTSLFPRLRRQSKQRRGSLRFPSPYLCENLESRLLLSTAALEVWAGNNDLSGHPDSLYNVDQSGYTQLGVSNTPNAGDVFTTAGTHYNYFVIVTRGQVQVDSVQGSDSTYLSTIESTGSTSDGGANMTGARDGNFTTIGTSVDQQGTFAGYAEFANSGTWTALTVQTGSMGVMLMGQVELERDYLPGGANPYDYDSTLELDDNSLITAAEVRNPSGVWYPLTLNTDSGNPDAQWTFENNYSSSASLSAAVPNGVYTFEAQSPFGTTTTQFSYSMPSLTPVIAPTGLTDGMTGVSTSPTFQWSAINDPNLGDNLQLEVDGPNSNNTVIDQSLANTSVTSYSPPSPLTASSNYDLELRLQSFSQTTNSDGFALNTEIDNETDLVFRTAGSAASAPGLYLTSVGLPSGTIYPGTWFSMPATGGNSGGNAIGKSGGVVVPIQYEAVLSTSKTWGASGNIIIGQGAIGTGSGGAQIGGNTFSGGPLVQIPTSVTPGTAYYLGIKGDSTGVISGNTGSTTAWSSTKITITPNGTIAVTPPATQSVTVGKSKSFALGSFTQSATNTPYAVDVNWGDGSADSIFAVAAAGTIPAAAHTYATSGTKTVNLTVSDWDGEATKSTSFSANVLLPVTTATAVSSTLNPAIVGASVTLQATVSPNTGNGNTATGMVTFKDGTTTLGTGSLNGSGVASYVTSSLALGTHPITAVYAGDGNFTGSTSTVVLNQFIVNSHSTNLAYVAQLYNDLLGRAPDSGGLNYWTGLLDAGTTIQIVAAGIANSNESNANVVTSLYEDILGRAPDSGGLAYWTGQLDAGATVNSIRNGFFASNEYYANQGGTDADWINAVYQYYLGRAPDSGGLSYWEGVLSAGGASASDINPTRLSAANYIGASPEYYNDVVSNAYEKYLLRAVDSGALSYYSNALFTNALTVNQFIVDLVTSPEYFTVHSLG